jgi:hypothetical protein
LSVPCGPYRAVDGDTVHINGSLGLDEYAYRMIRIKDAFVLILPRRENKVARDFLAQLLPLGTRCKLTTERDVTSFGRYVASIELEDWRDVAPRSRTVVLCSNRCRYPVCYLSWMLIERFAAFSLIRVALSSVIPRWRALFPMKITASPITVPTSFTSSLASKAFESNDR